jgi:serine protease Do
VVTNWHVINEATGPISVHFPDGFYSLATPQKIDRDWDLALLAIHKPKVAPVPLADEAPRPGDLLTIAGYGSGAYRAASGPCTQYVAPGETFPFEMLEVAVSARQGDSGGPILNSRGELAGVLFGEGNGRTSGSYCGRVRWFLSSVAPLSQAAPQIAMAPLAPIAARPGSDSSTQSQREQPQEPARIAQQDTGRQLAGDTAFPVLATSVSTSRHVSPVAGPPPEPVVASTRSTAAALPPAQVIGWQDLAGDTIGAQIKSVLAAIGLLAMIVHVLKWMSSEPADA